MIEEVAPGTWVRYVPAAPLLAALLHGLMIGVLRRALSSRAIALVTLGSVGASFVFSAIAFAELIAATGDAAIVDRVGTWIGVGVGSSALVVDLTLRFDPLSAVMCMLVSSVGLILLVYAVADVRNDRRDDRGEQRFFAFASLLLASTLLLVLADGLVLLAAAWCGVGLATWWLLGFWYGEPSGVRVATIAFALGRLGDAALFGGVALVFWALADAGVVSAGLDQLREARPVLAEAGVRWPVVLGGGAVPVPEVVALLVLVAMITKAAQLPLTGWMGEAVEAPTAALALVHTVTTVAAPIYVAVRLSFVFADAPIASAAAAWVGAATALVAAAIACTQVDLLRLLAWSTASQLGFAFVAIGAAVPTAAIFHLAAHSFHKGVLFIVAGVVILEVGLERDVWRMGNLGSRLWLTRIYTWVAILSLAGLAPVGAGFFSLEQVVVAAGTADLPGRGVLVWIALLAVMATGFYAVRMMYLVFYGDTRIPAGIRWEEIEDPGNGILWPMGLLAGLVVVGAVVGFPQIWADLLFDDVENANSLHHFLESTVVVAEASGVDPGLEWTIAGRSMMLALLGALPAVWLYLYRREWLDVLEARLGVVHRALRSGLQLEPALRRVVVAPLLAAADRVLGRFVEGRIVEGVGLRGSARLVQGVADGLLKHAQSGSVPIYLGTAVIASLLLLLYLLDRLARGA